MLLVTSEIIFKTSCRLILQISLADSRTTFHFLSVKNISHTVYTLTESALTHPSCENSCYHFSVIPWWSLSLYSPFIFSLFSYCIAFFAFSSSPSHFTSYSTLLPLLLPSVFPVLLLTWVKNPNWIDRVLPNRWERQTENNGMYRHLQTLTVLPVSIWQTEVASQKNDDDDDDQKNPTPRLLRLN